ncbi:MAG: Macrolide export protein MacA [Pelotomaculum sp. PtaB.Bin013]|uniref:Efflux RND transporter periplasmic adaptor subunit n=1 Tax=Pelotomaculum isophthalicicum JI TaxID=947010 RepID=A0A9X4H7N0_9FIRM|nr:efflux RND transporter periplasmic adaptor subunit [Pelotomaculum isophthalicicum]MDF9409749.1 efflux RND transporter periplasmic adaptor subunit [Pelotomaculum isophthalicicum JI]OPX90586.1 MAG: Macrolide export protein MacA [Pelotomaculum sp. PtaB.Bin013]
MHKRISKSLAIFLALLLLFAVSGCAEQKTNNPTTVTTAVADNQELETTLELSGVLVPAQTVDLSSKISGQVTNLGFNVGSAVKAGDVLIQLDTEALKAQLMQAEAGLQSAEAAAQSVQNQASLAKINLDAAQKLYERTKSLYEAGAVSQSQMDDTTDKLNIAKNQSENASGPAQNQAQAAINTAQANIKNLQVQIDNATIRSPLDGIVTNQSVNVGTVVSPGVPVISIVDTSILKMKCTVTQDLLPLLSINQEMDIKIDSYPESKFKGSISSIGPIAVSTGEVFPVEISIKNNGSLTAGLSAHASMNTKVSGVVVPASSVAQNGGENCVFIIKDNIASKRVVRTGLKNDKGTQILMGVNAGESVAITNVNTLTDKMPVNAN